MIDVGSFAEWILAKAEKQHGVSATNDANIRAVRAAVESAIAANGDDVHVTCTLRGSGGRVQIDERLTRTAAENLFEKHSHVPALKPEKPKQDSLTDEERERRDKRIEEIRTQRVVFMVVAITLAMAFVVGAILSFTKKEHSDQHEEHRDKREMHH